jgi:hypothetical protein
MEFKGASLIKCRPNRSESHCTAKLITSNTPAVLRDPGLTSTLLVNASVVGYGSAIPVFLSASRARSAVIGPSTMSRMLKEVTRMLKEVMHPMRSGRGQKKAESGSGAQAKPALKPGE